MPSISAHDRIFMDNAVTADRVVISLGDTIFSLTALLNDALTILPSSARIVKRFDCPTIS
jgi:hypothetical protein